MLKPLKIIEVYGCNGCPHFCGDSRQGYYCMKLNILAKVDGILNECPLTEWNTRPAPDKTGFEECPECGSSQIARNQNHCLSCDFVFEPALSSGQGEKTECDYHWHVLPRADKTSKCPKCGATELTPIIEKLCLCKIVDIGIIVPVNQVHGTIILNKECPFHGTIGRFKHEYYKHHPPTGQE